MGDTLVCLSSCFIHRRRRSALDACLRLSAFSAEDAPKLAEHRERGYAQDDVQEQVRGHGLVGRAADADVLVEHLRLHRVAHLAGLAFLRRRRRGGLLSVY